MSEDEKRFLARWSQRKLDAAKSEPEPSDERPRPATEARSAEGEKPLDLESLPKLEDLTADTDMTVFFRKGVPESIRNAALRKSWALDPAIRNYVNPALDYAYDWNMPGGVPGGGELAPGTDVARMVSQVFGGVQSASSQETVDKGEHVAAPQGDHASALAAEQTETEALQPVRLSQPSPDFAEVSADAADIAAAVAKHSDDQPDDQHRSFAPQQIRRHGSARPK